MYGNYEKFLLQYGYSNAETEMHIAIINAIHASYA